MSEAVKAERVPSFFELYAAGKVPADAVDDYVDAWHDGPKDDPTPLHEFLGLSWAEYAEWAKDDRALTRILAARRDGTPLEVVPALARFEDEAASLGPSRAP